MTQELQQPAFSRESIEMLDAMGRRARMASA